ncbi:MAG TPA: 50S ribosomal protein L35 [Candidatus Omnitrophota bacterium]|nr:50S ribosomal protein L35 [Candidatus Omnitrophota bacterium]
MPKQKTKKAVRKRFKLSAKGKVLKPQAFRRHLLGDKSSSRKRSLRRLKVVDHTQSDMIKRCLPYG